MSFAKNKTVKTNKQHQCFSCLRKFDKGTLMDKWTNVHEGDWSNGYTCLTCVAIHNQTTDLDWLIPEGYVHECLEQNETPEMYLETLKEKP